MQTQLAPEYAARPDGQEAEAILQHFENARARNRHAFVRQVLQNREHHVLLAHGRAVFYAQFLGKCQKFCG